MNYAETVSHYCRIVTRMQDILQAGCHESFSLCKHLLRLNKCIDHNATVEPQTDGSVAEEILRLWLTT